MDNIDIKIEEIKNKIELLSKNLKVLESAKIILTDNKEKKFKIKQNREHKNSIGTLALNILKDNVFPLHVNDLKSKLEDIGKEVTNITITNACMRLIEKKLLEKTEPNTFKIAKRELSRAKKILRVKEETED